MFLLNNISQKSNIKPDEYRKKMKGEVFTPEFLVINMLSTLPKKLFNNTKLKWLDPCNGEGAFPLKLIEYLDKGLKNKIKSRTSIEEGKVLEDTEFSDTRNEIRQKIMELNKRK